jgi:hypothetical protein
MLIGEILTKNKLIQSLTGVAEESDNNTDDKKTETLSEFESFLKGILKPDSANNISEEELFAGVLQERVKGLKGSEIESKFTELLNKEKDRLRKPDGYIPFEDAAKSALKQLRDGGSLTKEEADQIYSESFAAAQLDTNTEVLFDNRGGDNDPTIAVQQLEQALLGARTTLEGFVTDASKVKPRSLDEASNSKASSLGASSNFGFTSNPGDGSVPITNTPNGTTFDGPDGFLFKPVSNNQGTLAVLLPPQLAYLVSEVVLKDSNDNVIDSGRSTGYGDTGEREKFSFNKRGGEYPKDIKVEVRLLDGTTREYFIPDPSKRYD